MSAPFNLDSKQIVNKYEAILKLQIIQFYEYK